MEGEDPSSAVPSVVPSVTPSAATSAASSVASSPTVDAKKSKGRKKSWFKQKKKDASPQPKADGAALDGEGVSSSLTSAEKNESVASSEKETIALEPGCILRRGRMRRILVCGGAGDGAGSGDRAARKISDTPRPNVGSRPRVVTGEAGGAEDATRPMRPNHGPSPIWPIGRTVASKADSRAGDETTRKSALPGQSSVISKMRAHASSQTAQRTTPRLTGEWSGAETRPRC